MAGLRVFGRAFTTTPVLGFSVLPPPRLSLSLIAPPCLSALRWSASWSSSTAPRQILPLANTDHIGSRPPVGSIVCRQPKSPSNRQPRATRPGATLEPISERHQGRFARPLAFGKRHGLRQG